jgi:hypothetical protein
MHIHKGILLLKLKQFNSSIGKIASYEVPINQKALIAFQGDEFASLRTAVDAASSRVVSAVQRL